MKTKKSSQGISYKSTSNNVVRNSKCLQLIYRLEHFATHAQSLDCCVPSAHDSNQIQTSHQFLQSHPHLSLAITAHARRAIYLHEHAHAVRANGDEIVVYWRGQWFLFQSVTVQSLNMFDIDLSLHFHIFFISTPNIILVLLLYNAIIQQCSVESIASWVNNDHIMVHISIASNIRVSI